MENLAEAFVKRIRQPIIVAPGGSSHVATFAAERGPAAFGRTDDTVERAKQIAETIILIAVSAVHETRRSHVPENGRHVSRG